ncbi:endonuclease [uncultured Winogradskyella sp.]|uniref:endonuclease n=1 Tax=uncultured Winogradskyella sp. TaxID=395353 RepID=UPI002634EA67|nr:endonuclease [uncultured Winogradskyella sp.]
MKHLYLLLVLMASYSYGQIPANYYDSADGLSGYALKTELKNIISNGYQTRTYDQLFDGAGISGSNGYIDTHSDIAIASGNQYENDGTILDMYSENPLGSDPYNYTHGNDQCGNQMAEGDCYNREHLIPQSSFNSAFPMQSDIHHVIPTDGRVNNFRGSLPFGNVASPNFTSLNGSQRGTSNMPGYSGLVFEPIDEFKGDIARALLYFATRYEDTVDNYTSFDMFNGTNDEVFFPWAIDVLLEWHNNVDPVDQRERDRNEAAYAFQNNANPFVDHPEYASLIWNPTIDTEAPSAPSNLVASNPTISTIDLSWNASTDNIAVTSYDIFVDGTLNTSTSSTSITITGLLANTDYCFTVFARDDALNTSTSSNQDCETTNEGTSSSNELFISEYIEGSSNNKAIEIANFTGAPINLSVYSIARDVNSNGAFGDALQLTGTLQDSEVHVIARGNASAGILAEADQLSSADAMSFNGDDPIGLFKNGNLIDIFGIVGGNNDYDNQTYRRKETVTQPTTAFNLAGEWDAFPTDNIDNLGNHQLSLNIQEFKLQSISFYPNPIKNELHISLKNNVNTSIEIYNILGKRVFKDTIDTSSKLNVQALKSGVYILKIKQGNIIINKRLVKN